MIATLQSLRFVFVMMIFMSHFAYRDIGPFDAGGDCGVAFFFMLSGFVVSMGYGRQIQEGSFHYGRFLRKRFWKLYPLHLLCLLFWLVVSQSVIDGRVVLNLFLLQSWIPDNEYYFSCNSVSWFLSCLLFCYLLFPWAYKHVSKGWTAGVLATYVMVCLLTPYEDVNAILYVNPLVRFVDFYIGVVLCRIYEKGYSLSGAAWIEWFLFIILALLLAVYPYADEKLRNAPLYWLVLVPVILVFSKEQGPLSRLLKTRPLLMLASLSMPIFMTHQMLISLLFHWFPDMPVVVMLFLCIFMVLVVSWLIDRFVLKPTGKFI